MQNATQPDSPAKKKGQISFRTARNAVARHPIIFGGLILVSTAVAVGVWLLMPLPKNTATVVFQLSGHAPRVITTSIENQIDIRTYGSLQAATLKRRQVLSNALKSPELGTEMEKAPFLRQESDPVAWMDKNITVDFRNGLEFMRVVLEGDHPEELVAILRAVTASFLAAVDQRDNGSRKQRLVLIEDSIVQQQGEIGAKLKRLDVIAQSLKTTDGPTLAIMESLNQDELRTARREQLDLQQKIERLRSEMPQPGAEMPPIAVPPALVDDAVRREPELLQADAKVANAKQLLKDTEAKFEPGSSNANLTRAKQDLAVAESNRDKLRLELKGQVEESMKQQVVAEAKRTAIRQKDTFEQLERGRQIAEKQLKEIVTRIEKHGEYRVELDKLRKEVSSTEKVLATLTDERDSIRVEERAPSRVTLAEQAFVQSGVEGMRRMRMVAMSSIGIFLAGFIGLVWFEHRGRRVTSVNELTEANGITILGTVPSPRPGESLSNRHLVESVDALRTVILHTRSKDRPLRTIMVASGLSGEGKTTLSGHLALSLSRAGYRVLLLDGDLHAPTAQRLFELPATPGFCEVLREESTAVDAIHPAPIPGLFVMTAGSWNMATRQCLVGERWAKLREELQQEFDFVIVDTAPLLLLADTLLLANAVDGVVLSVLLGTSRLGAVGLTHDRLQSLGVRVLGAVVNGSAAEYTSDNYGPYKYPMAEPAPIPLTIA